MHHPRRAASTLSLLVIAALPAVGQQELQVISPSNSTAGDEFGVAVDADGPIAIVRSRWDAFVFERSGSDWIESTQLTFSTPYTESNLGPSVAVLQDLAALGLPSAENAPGFFTGGVELFERSGPDWPSIATLFPAEPLRAQLFGYSLAFDNSGGARRLLVGDPLRLDGPFSLGSAHLFEEGPGGWTEIQTFQAFDASLFDWYGMAVAIHGDRIAIGARFEDAGIQNSGSTYLYRADANGVFQLEQKLISPEPEGFGEFGRSLELDENWLAVAEIRADKLGIETGTVHMYRDPAGFFEYHQRLDALETGEFDSFGISLDLEGDTLAVGACYDDQGGQAASDEGAAYLFRENGGVWTQTARYTSAQSGNASLLGWSVALSGDDLLCGTLKDYGSGAGVPGTLHSFDALDVTPCTAYRYGSGLPGLSDLVWVAGTTAVGPFLAAIVGPEVGSTSLLAVSANTAYFQLLDFPVLIDLATTTVLPMANGLGFATASGTLPPATAGLEAIYLQAFSFSPATSQWAASEGLRVALCP